MYVYVCVFWHLDSKKDCTLQVLHALCLASNSKARLDFNKTPLLISGLEHPSADPYVTICTTEPLRQYIPHEN